AEQVVGHRVPAPIVRQVGLAGDEPEHLRPGVHRPQPHLPADRAVAFAGAGADVHIHLEANGAAMAASRVGFQHRVLVTPSTGGGYCPRLAASRTARSRAASVEPPDLLGHEPLQAPKAAVPDAMLLQLADGVEEIFRAGAYMPAGTRQHMGDLF